MVNKCIDLELPLINQGKSNSTKLNFVMEVTKSKKKDVLVNTMSRGGCYAAAVYNRIIQ